MLHEIGTKQISQVPRSRLDVHTYAIKDSQTRELFVPVIFGMNFFVTLITVAWIVLFVLENIQGETNVRSVFRLRS